MTKCKMKIQLCRKVQLDDERRHSEEPWGDQSSAQCVRWTVICPVAAVGATTTSDIRSEAIRPKLEKYCTTATEDFSEVPGKLIFLNADLDQG